MLSKVLSSFLFIPLKCEAHAGQYTSRMIKEEGIELVYPDPPDKKVEGHEEGYVPMMCL